MEINYLVFQSCQTHVTCFFSKVFQKIAIDSAWKCFSVWQTILVCVVFLSDNPHALEKKGGKRKKCSNCNFYASKAMKWSCLANARRKFTKQSAAPQEMFSSLDWVTMQTIEGLRK